MSTMSTTVMEPIEDIPVPRIVKIVRECARRILEMAEDRPKLRELRKEAATLKKRISGMKNTRNPSSYNKSGGSKRRWEIDEDAFYNRQKPVQKKQITNTDKYDDYKESTLAKKLGLDEDVLEQAKKLQEEKDKMKKDKTYRKAKEQEEKEINEVKKIIEEGGGIGNYLREIDILDGSDEEEKKPGDNTNIEKFVGLAPPPSKSPQPKKPEPLDLLDLNIAQDSEFGEFQDPTPKPNDQDLLNL